MNKIFCFIALFIFVSETVLAQEVSDSIIEEIDIFRKLESKDGFFDGKIAINQDEVIRNLVLNHILFNKQIDGIPGYRIRIFSESGQSAREKAEEAKQEFEENYPGINAYLRYDVPFFKVYVGDLRTKTEALIHLNEIKRDYPSAFYLKDWINYPDLN